MTQSIEQLARSMMTYTEHQLQRRHGWGWGRVTHNPPPVGGHRDPVRRTTGGVDLGKRVLGSNRDLSPEEQRAILAAHDGDVVPVRNPGGMNTFRLGGVTFEQARMIQELRDCDKRIIAGMFGDGAPMAEIKWTAERHKTLIEGILYRISKDAERGQ